VKARTANTLLRMEEERAGSLAVNRVEDACLRGGCASTSKPVDCGIPLALWPARTHARTHASSVCKTHTHTDC
jgi:hypothetical protein